MRVRTPAGQLMTLPAWMTDKWICRDVKFRKLPSCSVSALLELRNLLSIMMNGNCR